METKICTKCGQTKQKSMFPKGRNRCKQCRALEVARSRYPERFPTEEEKRAALPAGGPIRKLGITEMPATEKQGHALNSAQSDEFIRSQLAESLDQHNELIVGYKAMRDAALKSDSAVDFRTAQQGLQRAVADKQVFLKDVQQILEKMKPPVEETDRYNPVIIDILELSLSEGAVIVDVPEVPKEFLEETET